MIVKRVISGKIINISLDFEEVIHNRKKKTRVIKWCFYLVKKSEWHLLI